MSSSSTASRRPIVTIDGPAGAGKSTVAAFLAQRFGLLNLETGAMYRAFAAKALAAGVDCDREGALVELSLHTQLHLEPRPEGNQVFLDGVDVSGQLRTPEVTRAASRVSVHPAVRRWMVDQQRELGRAGGVVMEGRDIGTVVFPEAEVKIFLDADPEVRGDRRFRQTGNARDDSPEQQGPGHAAILREMRDRDARDRTRVESPLRPAADAVVIDSTSLTLPEVLERASTLVLAAMPPR